MHRYFTLLAAGLFLGAGLSAQSLSGTYAIPAQYKTFAAAAADLGSKGVSGPVTFLVAPGNYTESFTLPYVGGASATNKVTFRSLVPGMAKLTGASGATLTFAAGASSAQPVAWYVIDGFEFTGGPGYALHGNRYNYDIEIRNCDFKAAHATGLSSSSARLWYLQGSYIYRWDIHHNTFAFLSKASSYSMYFSQIQDCKFHHNTVEINGGYYGFYLINTNNSRNHYYNNIFHGTLQASSSATVFFISASQYDVHLGHNTFLIDTTTAGGSIVVARGCCTTRRSWLYSNIFYNTGDGPCIKWGSTSTSYPIATYYRGDGNIFWRPGTTPVVVGLYGTTKHNLTSWQQLTGQDQASKVGDPGLVNPFQKPYIFKLRANALAKDMGVAFPGQPTFPAFPITDDFEGNPRDSKPDVGAYEVTNFNLFGRGCAGTGSFVPELGYTGQAAIGGANFNVTLAKALGGSAALLAIGSGNTSWGPITLPFDFGGCDLNVPITLGVSTPVAGSGGGNGTASVPLPIPNDPALAGARFYLQWLVIDAGSPSPFGVVSTLGGEVAL